MGLTLRNNPTYTCISRPATYKNSKHRFFLKTNIGMFGPYFDQLMVIWEIPDEKIKAYTKLTNVMCCQIVD